MGRAVAIAVVLGLAATPAVTRAQTDYRNLDDGRPVRTEDAFVVDRYGFELLAPLAYDADVGGAARYFALPELEYGFADNAQLGVKLPVGAVDSAGSSTFGLGGVLLSEIYNFNSEGPALPAISARFDLFLPLGDLAGDRALGTLKAIATRTFGLTRLHLNGAWTFGTSAVSGPRLEAPPRWFAGAAVDHTFFRPSLLVAGELTASQD